MCNLPKNKFFIRILRIPIIAKRRSREIRKCNVDYNESCIRGRIEIEEKEIKSHTNHSDLPTPHIEWKVCCTLFGIRRISEDLRRAAVTKRPKWTKVLEVQKRPNHQRKRFLLSARLNRTKSFL